MLKIVLIGIAAIFLSMAAGSVKGEYGFLIALCAGLLIFSFSLGKIQIMLETIQAFEESVGINHEYVALLLKMVGIAWLSQLAVSMSRDAGQSTIAGQIAFFGKVSMLLVSVPVLRTIIETIGEMLA